MALATIELTTLGAFNCLSCLFTVSKLITLKNIVLLQLFLTNNIDWLCISSLDDNQNEFSQMLNCFAIGENELWLSEVTLA